MKQGTQRQCPGNRMGREVEAGFKMGRGGGTHVADTMADSC